MNHQHHIPTTLGQLLHSKLSASSSSSASADNEALAALQKLANAGEVNDEFSALTVNINNKAIVEEIKLQKAEMAREATRAAATTVIKTLEQANKKIEVYRQQLAEARRLETTIKAAISNIAMLVEYGNITSDYTHLHSCLISGRFNEAALDTNALNAAKAVVAEKLKVAKPAAVAKKTAAK